MSDFDTHNRTKALAFAEELANLARRSPSREIKSKIMVIVNAVRGAYGMSEQAKLETVFELIVDGAATVDDLLAETGFTRQTLSELIGNLEITHHVRVVYINNGRPGPPRQLIVPLNH